MAHGASSGRPAGSKKCVYQGAQGTHGIHPGLASAPQDKDLDGPQLSERHVQVEVFIKVPDSRMDIAFQLLVAKPGYTQGAHFWNEDLTISINLDSRLQFYHPPYSD